MVQKINEYREDNYIVEQYSKDGETISHIVRKVSPLYFIKLYTDKNTVYPDGKDLLTITAKIYNLENELQTNWKENVIFTIENEELEIQIKDGEASMTFSTELSGEFTIKASSPNSSSKNVKVVAINE